MIIREFFFSHSREVSSTPREKHNSRVEETLRFSRTKELYIIIAGSLWGRPLLSRPRGAGTRMGERSRPGLRLL